MRNLLVLAIVFMMLAQVMVPVALAAELVSVEVVSNSQHAVIEVQQGETVNFTINLTAEGSISGSFTSSNPNRAAINTVYSVTGTSDSSSTPSSYYDFYASSTLVGGSNYLVTWNGAPAAYEVPATASASLTAEPGDYVIRIAATFNNPSGSGGKLGDTTGDYLTIRVIEATSVTNSIPSVAADCNSVIVDEGQTAFNTGTWSDQDSDDNVILTASVGSVTKLGDNNDGTWSWSYDTTDGPTQGQAVTITANDGNEGVTTTSFSLTVNNVAPTATFGNNGPLNEGSSFTLSMINPYDPSSVDTTAGFEYAFDCGAGYGNFSAGNSFTCPTADNGIVNVKGKIRDKDGGVSEYNATIAIYNVAPAITLITGPIGPVEMNTPVTMNATFTDPGTDDTHSAVWSWGDGTETSMLLGTVASPVTGSHIYSAAGIYTVTLTVTDDDNGSGVEIYQYVVVYDPSAGFVTGGGWIMSPAGAYSADESLAGKASFGFVSKYQKGAKVPTGQTEFQFKAGDLNFQSSSYEWLVISGSKATYKGIGTINGAGDYGFMLTATDGGNKGVDTFRIKIWDRSNNDAVIYDNQVGSSDKSDSANPTTIVSGGNIVIHSK
ncbi:PKD domain-containing protein [Methanolobus chelungpuianus]|uniref:PKD domain-containing protein n=1 Tax=Methanolobus chelungpuianus TaxID=502115 RepID=UPI0021140125|nr:PKD domain-containing protein [Methanolobus chelungpuianus]